MTTLADQMMDECNQQMNTLASLRAKLLTLAPELSKFESGSAEIMSGKPWICLYRPESPEAAKAFCRAWGGNWFSDKDGGRVNYTCKDDRGSVCIFGAETFAPQPLPL